MCPNARDEGFRTKVAIVAALIACVATWFSYDIIM